MSKKQIEMELFGINFSKCENSNICEYLLFKNKILVGDEILTSFPKNEIKAILFHERFHQIDKTFTLIVVISLVLLIIIFAFLIKFNSIVVTIICRLALILLLTIIIMLFKRNEEYKADKYSISQCNSAESLINGITRYSKLQSKKYRKLFGWITHPSHENRFKKIREYKENYL